ncbi:MAG: hypothetical protein JW958_12520 [Candidatus Eisenbacteria bacterium]|nr:hypothetical protein [Candidatus Eisenbacteria bacterium]
MRPDLDSNDPEWKRRSSRWRVQRVRRKIARGYYDRPEVRAQIVDALLQALLEDEGRRPSTDPK